MIVEYSCPSERVRCYQTVVWSLMKSLYRTHPGELLVREWGTDLLADPSFFRAMALVRVPDGLVGPDGPEVTERGEDGQPHYDYTHANYIVGKLQSHYKVEVHNVNICDNKEH